MDSRKKVRERRILDLVYGDRSLHAVREHERPDFLIQSTASSTPFGVEVTEFFDSETSARLDRIDGYMGELLDGGPFRHKHDAQAAEVGPMDVVAPDGSVVATGIIGLIREIPPPRECARRVAERIQAKGEGLSDVTRCSHLNLIVSDDSRVLATVKREDFYRRFFIPELQDAARSTVFREVFFCTILDDERVYVPLKELLLFTEAFFFVHTLFETGVREQVEGAHGRAFAAYLASRVEAPVLFQAHATGVEVLFGDTGVVLDGRGVRTLRSYRDSAFDGDAVAPDESWLGAIGSQFLAALEGARLTHTFRSNLAFAVAKGR